LKIIVTGSAGYLGSRCVSYFEAQGHELLPIDIKTQDGAASVDLSAESKAMDLFTRFRPDLVLHLAAIAAIPACEDDPVGCWRNNVETTFSVAKAAQNVGAQLVFFSSAAVYGTPDRLPTPTTDPTRPTNLYGISKATGELVVRAYCERSIVLRLFNIYGGRCERSYVLPDLIRKLQTSSPKVQLSGTGEESRDFLHISDLMRLMDRATAGPDGAIYNAGTGTTTTIRSAASHLARLMGRGDAQFEFTGPRKKDFRINWADVSEGNVPQGWAPKVSLEEGLLEMIQDAGRPVALEGVTLER
jgi:UDP-glucose 4-epimerase